MSKRDPYGDRLTQLETWAAANREAAEAACAGKVRPADLMAVLRLLVSRTNKATGVVSESRKQIAEATWLTENIVKLTMPILTALGVIETVVGPRSGGRGGAAGRPAVLRVTFLAAVDNTPAEQEWRGSKPEMAVQPDRNGGAADCTPPRVLTTETPHGFVSELVNNSDRAAIRSQGGNESKERRAGSSWADRVVTELAAQLLSEEPHSKVISPEAVTRKKANILRPHLDDLLRRYPLLPTAPIPSAAYNNMRDILRCKYKGEEAHSATYGYLEPYRAAG